MLNERLQPGLIRNVGGAVAAGLVVNAVIFAGGWNASTAALRPPPLNPPDAVVGAVWVALFAAMGAARFLIVSSGRSTARADGWAVVGLIAFCCAYPVYTRGLSDLRIAAAGNVATLAAVVITAAVVRRDSRRAARLILPAAGWLVFATYLVFATIAVNA